MSRLPPSRCSRPASRSSPCSSPTPKAARPASSAAPAAPRRSTKKASIRSGQAMYVPADDLTDPAPAAAFAHLDATTVLSRAISEMGIYPAVDPLASTSTILSARIVGEEHYKCARDVQAVLQ